MRPAVHVVPPAPPAQYSPQAGSFYYDYSEQFEETAIEKHITQVYEETVSTPVPTGFVHRIKSLLEEKAVEDLDPASPTAPPTPNNTLVKSPPLEIAELPATPVAVKRITREMILSAISLTSDESDSESDEPPSPRRSSTAAPSGAEASKATIEPVEPIPQEPVKRDNRQSVVSSAPTMRFDGTASTNAIGFAQRYSMPGSTPPSMPPSTNSLGSQLEIIEDEPEPHREDNHQEQESPIRNEPKELLIAMPTPVKRPSIARLVSRSEMVRPNTLFVSSTAGVKQSPSRHSLPLNRVAWPSAEMKNSDHQGSTTVKPKSVPIVTQPPTAFELPAEASPQIQVQPTTAKLDPASSPITPLDLSENAAKRLSLAQSPVSPLPPHEPPQESTPRSRESVSTTHLSTLWTFRKPVPMHAASPASSREADRSKEPTTENTTTELRFSALHPTGQLADIKEAPSLENSQADLRRSTFKFPMPATNIPKAPIDRIRRSVDVTSKRNSVPDSVVRAETRSLYDTRAIPSLNFSQINLFSKLNEALDQRRRSSLDTFPRFFEDTQEHMRTPGVRDSGVIREKYRSLFSSLDDSETHLDGISGRVEELDMQEEVALGEPQGAPHDSPDDAEANTTVGFPTLRPLSPDELIDEVNRISVPSITALTNRLSEILPSLKRYYAGKGTQAIVDPVESTITEIRSLGNNVTPVHGHTGQDSVDGWRSDNPRVVEDVTEASELEANIAMPPPELRPHTPRRSASHPGLSTPLAELEPPSPAVLRARSLSDSGVVDTQMHNLRASHAALSSRRSFAGSSPAESRPWNLEASYPWANSVPQIDISLPPTTFRREVVQQPSKLRLRISEDSDDTHRERSTAKELATATSPMTPMMDYTDTTQSTQDTFSNQTKRKMSRRSILGSLTRKIRLGGGPGPTVNNSGYPTGPNIFHGEERAVDPGDRYPTTGLLQPSTFNLEEVRSFFSDDSSHLERQYHGGSFRKRLTQLKSKIPPVTRTQSALEHRNPAADRSESFFGVSQRSVTGGSMRMYPDGTMGMSRAEFIRKKISERLKSVWYRGTEIFRTMSVRKKATHPPRSQTEHPEQEERHERAISLTESNHNA
jgi:hypothetical protein